VGESHHLANTFPPEIWSRVVVLPWPRLSSARKAIESSSQGDVGLALEYGLQSAFNPLANSARRTAAGGWRAVNREKSSSRGARAYHQISELFSEVKEVWARAEVWQPGQETLAGHCHVVFPAERLRTVLG